MMTAVSVKNECSKSECRQEAVGKYIYMTIYIDFCKDHEESAREHIKGFSGADFKMETYNT
jgi:hypothetical protein